MSSIPTTRTRATTPMPIHATTFPKAASTMKPINNTQNMLAQYGF